MQNEIQLPVLNVRVNGELVLGYSCEDGTVSRSLPRNE